MPSYFSKGFRNGAARLKAPTADGAAGQVVKTDGAGQLSFGDISPFVGTFDIVGPASTPGTVRFSDTAGGLSTSISGGNSATLNLDATSIRLNTTNLGSGNNLTWATGNRFFRFLTNGNQSFIVEGSAAATVPMVLKAGASQTANLTEWQNSAGTLQAAISPAGKWLTNQTAAATALGSVAKKMPIYDVAGMLLGYLPLYDAIT